MLSESFINKESCCLSEELRGAFKRIHSHLTDIELISTQRSSRLREQTESISSRVDDIEKILKEVERQRKEDIAFYYGKEYKITEKTCSTCKWFLEGRHRLGENASSECQFNPPSDNGFPFVQYSDCCSKWEADK